MSNLLLMSGLPPQTPLRDSKRKVLEPSTPSPAASFQDQSIVNLDTARRKFIESFGHIPVVSLPVFFERYISSATTKVVDAIITKLEEDSAEGIQKGIKLVFNHTQTTSKMNTHEMATTSFLVSFIQLVIELACEYEKLKNPLIALKDVWLEEGSTREGDTLDAIENRVDELKIGKEPPPYLEEWLNDHLLHKHSDETIGEPVPGIHDPKTIFASKQTRPLVTRPRRLLILEPCLRAFITGLLSKAALWTHWMPYLTSSQPPRPLLAFFADVGFYGSAGISTATSVAQMRCGIPRQRPADLQISIILPCLTKSKREP
ncbi:hypothetical protein L218DRAFT_89270 [Marasmius fiardii PR-910]|nr:hypothetical protein L218DRAFT_89270 [Marasmius fiardii PR-910]